MAMPLTEADFALFEPAPAAAPAPRAKPRRQPMREVKPLKKADRQSQNERAHKVWMQSLIAYAVCGIVALCLFMVVQSEAGYHKALVEQRSLMATLEQAQQRNIGYQTQIERKYSLEIIQNHAQKQLHMIPVEGGRVSYINVSRGDERLN